MGTVYEVRHLTLEPNAHEAPPSRRDPIVVLIIGAIAACLERGGFEEVPAVSDPSRREDRGEHRRVRKLGPILEAVRQRETREEKAALPPASSSQFVAHLGADPAQQEQGQPRRQDHHRDDARKREADREENHERDPRDNRLDRETQERVADDRDDDMSCGATE